MITDTTPSLAPQRQRRPVSNDVRNDIRERLELDASGRRRAWTRRALWLLALLVALAAVLWFVRMRGQEGQGTQYVSRPAHLGDLVDTVTATGTLEALDTVEVGSETSGRILEVQVDFNDRVTKGQILATLDPEQVSARADQAAAQLQAARAGLARSEATRVEASRSFERTRKLAEAGLISTQDLETAQASAQRAQAEVASARAEQTVAQASLSAARSDLGKTAIRSPIDGIVLARSVEPGQTVAASLQAPVLFTIARDLTAMELHVDVDEADVGKVREGQTATFTVDAYPGRKFQSRLVSLHNVAKNEANVVTYEAVLSVDNADLSLRPGMTATAEVVAERIENVLLVPNAALRFTPPEMVTRSQNGPPSLIPGIGQRPGQRSQGSPQASSSPGTAAGRGRAAGNGNQGTVWVLREGKPAAVTVTKGASDGQNTEVRSAELKAGDEVLVDLVADPKTAKEAK